MNSLDGVVPANETRGASGDRARGDRARADRVRRPLYGWLARWLSVPYADRILVALGFVLLLPSLDTGLAADDYLQTIMLDRPSPIAGFQRAAWDLFRFCDPGHFAALFEQGVFSWWDDPHTKLAFLRPLSAATHLFDHAFFRNHGPVSHLHSALWALVLFLGVRALYRSLIADPLVANLALALYALDDARGWLVSWVAARNAAIATALSVWCLVWHHASRSQQRPGFAAWPAALTRVAGPCLLGCALLAGEGALATCGYLLGYALFIERGSLRSRSLSLLPYAVIVVSWRIAYRALGFGAYGSSLYVDPQTDPVMYVGFLLRNGPLLLGAQFGGMWSDVSTLLFATPRVQLAVQVVTCLFVGFVLWLMRDALRSSRLARFALFGMSCAVFPAVTATPAMDRLLTWIAIGASVLLALLIAPALRAGEGGQAEQREAEQGGHGGPSGHASHAGQTSRVHRLGVAVLVAAHLVGVVFLPSRARGNLVMRDTLGRAETAVPRDASVADKTLIFVNPPLLPYAAYLPIERAAQGIPRPRAQHILAMATTELSIERVDAYTLRLSPRAGFLLDPVSKLLWSEHRPFQVGERIVQGDMTVTILRVTPDRRPLSIEARFAQPLDDPRYLWVEWRDTHSVRFEPPATGTRVELPAADLIQSVLGVKLPIEARL